MDWHSDSAIRHSVLDFVQQSRFYLIAELLQNLHNRLSYAGAASKTTESLVVITLPSLSLAQLIGLSDPTVGFQAGL